MGEFPLLRPSRLVGEDAKAQAAVSKKASGGVGRDQLSTHALTQTGFAFSDELLRALELGWKARGRQYGQLIRRKTPGTRQVH